MATSAPVLTPVTNPYAAVIGSGTAASAKPPETTASADRFLTMLVTQLKNQDPLNPMDNAQITSQMAQINTVTGVEKVNESVKALNAQLLQMQTLQGASLVGREVLVDGNRLAVQDGRARGAVELDGDATKVTLTAFDASNNVIGTAELGPRKAGRVDFDEAIGNLPADRTYTFTVAAVNGKTVVPASTLAIDRVQSVGTAGGSLQLLLQRGGNLPIGAIAAFK